MTSPTGFDLFNDGSLVYASSNHIQAGVVHSAGPETVDFNRFGRHIGRTISSQEEIGPDSFYGCSKAYGEALARHYALNPKYDMTTVCLRIGWVTPEDAPSEGLTEEKLGYFRAMWLSHRDCAV